MVVDTEREAVVSVVEVKYLSGDDASDRVRSAVAQVVRYSRGYSELEAAGSLLENSIIVVSQGLTDIGSHAGGSLGVPMLTDFDRLQQGALAEWPQRLLQRPSS